MVMLTITACIVIRGAETFFEPMTSLFERLKTLRVSDRAEAAMGSSTAVGTVTVCLLHDDTTENCPYNSK
jgi:hypothetical protein